MGLYVRRVRNNENPAGARDAPCVYTLPLLSRSRYPGDGRGGRDGGGGGNGDGARWVFFRGIYDTRRHPMALPPNG